MAITFLEIIVIKLSYLMFSFITYLHNCIIRLWPVYYTGGGSANGWYHISMSNVQQGSWRTWFPAIFMWLTVSLYWQDLMGSIRQFYTK